MSEYDLVADRYDQCYSGRVERLQDRAAARFLRKWVRYPVVDLGCGTGLAARLLPKLGPYGYVGVDISQTMLDRARAQDGQFSWVRADMARTHLPAGQFGTAVFMYSLSYAPKPFLALVEAARLLRPGGSLLVWGAYGNSFDRSKALEEAGLEARFTRLSPSLLAYLAGLAGFEVRESFGFGRLERYLPFVPRLGKGAPGRLAPYVGLVGRKGGADGEGAG